MKQPPLITPREVDVPRAQRHTLPNGASLYAIPSDDFEVLRFTFVFRAGSSMQHAPFAASATANMLSEGSRDMTARQIAERLDFHGSYFEVNVDRDYVYISFSSLSKFFAPTLEVAEQILYEGENETYIEASVENSSSILYDKEIRNKPRTRRTKRNV